MKIILKDDIDIKDLYLSQSSNLFNQIISKKENGETFDVFEKDWNNEGKYIVINVDGHKGIILKKDLFITLDQKRKENINIILDETSDDKNVL
jgi:hypothetical protein